MVIALGVVVALTVAFVTAAGGWPWWTAAALLGWAGCEIALARVVPSFAAQVADLGAGRAVRIALSAVVIVLVAGRLTLTTGHLVGVATAVAVIVVLDLLSGALDRYLLAVRRPPLMTSGLDLSGALPAASPSRLLARIDGVACLAVVVVAVGLAITPNGAHSARIAALTLAVAVVLAAVPVGVLAPRAFSARRTHARARATSAAQAAVAGYAAQVVLYFAATPSELYQVRMWLEPLQRLDRRVAVVVRSHEVMDALGEVGVPVICTPYSGLLAGLPFADPFVALFVTHSGDNLPMLRRADARTVFVGHGDSDKADSANPFARVYDEVWVAGPLGRRRYSAETVGVADRAIVEVGRPQVARPRSAPPARTTIVYAPTWEGWGDDPHHSSLAWIGPSLVDALLARGVQVRYRPHPLTGRRSEQLRLAHRRILDRIGQVPAEETLFQTFESASALIGDVSSVISEFLVFDRPYAVPDTRGLGPAAFHDRFPSTAGGMVITADLDGLDALLVAAADGPDATRTARRELLADALGDPATAQSRFADAVTHLLAQ